MRAIRKILVTTDFSDFSTAGMEYAISLASSYRAQIWLLHVVDNTPLIRLPRVEKGSEAVLRQGVEKAAARLKDLAARVFPAGRSVTSVVRQGDPCAEIVKFAREEGMDIIVMATHGRTGISHVLMGSVAEKVVRMSAVPVLSVKPKPIRAMALRPEDIQEQLHLGSARRGSRSGRVERGRRKRIDATHVDNAVEFCRFDSSRDIIQYPLTRRSTT